MHGCLAPSEIPGVVPREASTFGGLAEDLIYADFRAQHPATGNQVFCDNHNPAGYLYFLAVNNPRFPQSLQEDYFRRVRGEGLMHVPDFMLHTPAERSFYEVKPDSASGRRDGMHKVGTLQAIYRTYHLPYIAGNRHAPRDHEVARMGSALRVTLRVQRIAPGLIVYRLCLDSETTLEIATLAALLAWIVRELNQQRGRRTFRPIDLEPALRQHPDLTALARTLGLTMAAAVVARAGWRHFWRAVVARFAVRGATAATLAAADGPLPIGDLFAAGLALWTIVDVIRLSDELWRDAERLAAS